MSFRTLTVFGCGLAMATSLVGCRSWTGGYPLQSPARVQPPGTGTYQVPSSYYNQTGANVSGNYQQGVPAQGYASMPANSAVPQSLNTGFAPTNLTNASPAMIPSPGVTAAGAQSGVVPAGYIGPATGQSGYSSGAMQPSSGGGASFNMSDSDASSLDWNP